MTRSDDSGEDSSSRPPAPAEAALHPIAPFPRGKGAWLAELRWPGKRALEGIADAEASLRASFGPPGEGWRDRIYEGENLAAFGHLLRAHREQVDLVYIDPPFDSGAEYAMRIKLRAPGTELAKLTLEEVQYRDVWAGAEYLDFIYERLAALVELLAPTGLICVHVDPRQSHRVRAILDELLGSLAFRAEIAWRLGNGAKSRSFVSNDHNSLLLYSKGTRWTFEADSPELREPFAAGSLQMHFREIDAAGRRFRRRKVGTKEYLYYADEGKRVGSVWTDLSSMRANSPIMAETTGYPTQKPESLLRRIVSAFSRPGDLVLDGFMGSGTTLAVAAALGRRFVGVDRQGAAVSLAIRRLLSGEAPAGAFDLYALRAPEPVSTPSAGPSAPVIRARLEADRLRIEGFEPPRLRSLLEARGLRVEDWRALVDRVSIDPDFDGEVLRPTLHDLPGRGERVHGEYRLPPLERGRPSRGRLRLELTDVLQRRHMLTLDR
ncbi:MAG: site-specific DNA-methyltransferase [Myxococcales bacterium]|nr:site-specific DNA-methyltransferase [Myxococcales bacterium]